MIKVKIKYVTKNRKFKQYIKEKCKIPPYETLNGTVEFFTSEDNIDILLSAESNNIIKILTTI